jgi:hypothetical protein
MITEKTASNKKTNKQTKSIKYKVEETAKYGINQKNYKGMAMVNNKCLRAA